VVFNKEDPNILYSGGWDDAVQIQDLRVGGPVGQIAGPHVCGESIDQQGDYLAAGSYRNVKALQIFDLRKTGKSHQNIDFDGGTSLFSECQLYALQYMKQG